MLFFSRNKSQEERTRKKETKTRNQKKTKKKDKKKTKTQEHQIKRFQLSVNLFFFGGSPKFPFYNLVQKARLQKHYRNRGFSNPFFENRFASPNGHFWTKNPKVEMPVVIFWAFNFPFNKKHKISRNPIL